MEVGNRGPLEMRTQFCRYFEDQAPGNGGGVYLRFVLGIKFYKATGAAVAILWQRPAGTALPPDVAAAWDFGFQPASPLAKRDFELARPGSTLPQVPAGSWVRCVPSNPFRSPISPYVVQPFLPPATVIVPPAVICYNIIIGATRDLQTMSFLTRSQSISGKSWQHFPESDERNFTTSKP